MHKKTKQCIGHEVCTNFKACDAQQFFDVDNNDLEKIKDEFSNDDTNAGSESESLKSLHGRFFNTDSATKLPRLPRDYFVHLWKNLMDLIEFGNLKDTTMEGRQEMYHSISLVGTHLLQMVLKSI